MDWNAALAGFAGGARGLATSLTEQQEVKRKQALDEHNMREDRAIRAMREAAAARDAENAPLMRVAKLAELRENGVVPSSEARDTNFDLGAIMRASGAGSDIGLHGVAVPVASSADRYKAIEPGSAFVQDQWNTPAAQRNVRDRLAEVARERLLRDRLDTSENNNIRSTTTSRANTTARVQGNLGAVALRNAAGQTSPNGGGANQRTAYIARRASDLERGQPTFGGRHTGGLSRDEAFAQAEQDAERIYGGARGPVATPAVREAAPPRTSGNIDLGSLSAAGITFDRPTGTSQQPIADPVSAAAQRIQSGAATLQQLEASGKSAAFKAAVRRQLGAR